MDLLNFRRRGEYQRSMLLMLARLSRKIVTNRRLKSSKVCGAIKLMYMLYNSKHLILPLFFGKHDSINHLNREQIKHKESSSRLITNKTIIQYVLIKLARNNTRNNIRFNGISRCDIWQFLWLQLHPIRIFKP